MFRTGLFFLGCTFFFQVLANTAVDVRIDRDNTAVLEDFVFIDETTEVDEAFVPQSQNTLVAENVTVSGQTRYTRYQQFHQGIRVMGRSVVRHESTVPSSKEETFYTGKLTKGLVMNIGDYHLSDEYRDKITHFATREYAQNRSSENAGFHDMDSQPVIWVDDDNGAALAYKVSFRARAEQGVEAWPHYLINATNQEIMHQWNNIQRAVPEQGPGGNQKTGKYQFGQAGMPALPVTRLDKKCSLHNDRVKVVSLNNSWSLVNPANPAPVMYPCGNNTGDARNGAWSPANDAFFFGNLVVDMYKNWYGQSVLKNGDGTNKQILMLVHAGKNYENAYWNGLYLVFGDGFNSYHPLVSLGVTSHEMAHALTSTYSNLLYFNQSGAINEAFSDMSAIAAEYYFMKNYAAGYQLVYGKNVLDWLIGDRIAKGGYAMRSMNSPHLFGSADCLDEGAGCHKSWDDIVGLSKQLPAEKRQSFIVHKGSGIFNRAFYYMVKEFDGDVRKVFRLMLKANMTRWSASADFAEAACGVKQVAKEVGYDVNKVHKAFVMVNIAPDC